MDPRFAELFRLPPNTHHDGCPVFINTGVIFRDNYSGQTLAQVIFGNLSLRNVVACKVEIRTFAVNGQALDTVAYQYMDLRIPQGGFFGGSVSIALPNPNTRRIQVLVREVVLDPFQVWNSTEDTLAPMPQPVRLDSMLPDPRHQQYYSARIGKPAMFIPRQEQGLFLCTCGQVNMAGEGPCRRCGSTFEVLRDALDPEAIHAAVAEQYRLEEEARIAAAQAAEAERIAREEEEAQRLAEKKARQKKARKRTLIITAILAVLLALAALTVFVIIPNIEQSNAYQAAVDLLNEERYADAESAFLELGDYKDAPTQALECRYQMAELALEHGEYQAAIDIFNSISHYADSSDRAEQALLDWKEEDYQAAVALMEAGAFTDAANAFAQLEDYKDAQAQQVLCLELQKEADYLLATETAAAGDYLGAMAIFRQLKGYQDADYQYSYAAYHHATNLFNNQEYQDAARYFQEAGDVEDAAQRQVESTYQYGCQLLAEEKFASAISVFETCADYSNTAKKLLEAKFGFCKAYPDPTNMTTYQYMKDLVAANYSGAKKMFNELYAWKVTIVAFNSSPYDSTVSQDVLSKYQYMCVHFLVSGGEPGASQDIRTVITLPSGYSGTVYHTDAKAGNTLCTYGWYDNPAYGASGTLTFRAYDEAGNLLVSTSVKVTS